MITLLTSALNTISQQTAITPKTEEYYLEKSKSQKRTATLLIVAGSAATVVGFIGAVKNFDPLSAAFGAPDSHQRNIYGGTLLVGLLSGFASIPFYLTSDHNKNLAAKVAVSNQNIYLLKQSNSTLSKIPVLTLKIYF